MLAGCYRIDITPPIGTPIGGNIRSDNLSRGVHDPLYANFLYLKSKTKKVLFIALDIIGVHRSIVLDIKKRIKSNLGISIENISIFATHTHSGPDVLEAFKDEYPLLITEYIEELKDKVIKGAIECVNDVWDARIGIGKGYEGSLSFNRRLLLEDGTLKMNWESIDLENFAKFAGPIDPELYVISVIDNNARIRSLIINFTLHSAILVGMDWLFSRDFIGPLTTNLQKSIGENLVVLFANGAQGNINHIDIYNQNQNRRFEETERIGNTLSTKALEILNHINYCKNFTVDVINEPIELPRREITHTQVKAAKKLLERVNWKIPSLLDGVPDEMYAKEIIFLSRDPSNTIETLLQVIQLGETAIVSLPGEFFVEFGLEIKEKSPFKNTLIFGMTNDYIGYVPTREAFEEGGYEIKMARTSQLQPYAGDIVVEKVINLLKKLKS